MVTKTLTPRTSAGPKPGSRSMGRREKYMRGMTKRVMFPIEAPESDGEYFEVSFDGTCLEIRSVPHRMVIAPDVSNRVTIKMEEAVDD